MLFFFFFFLFMFRYQANASMAETGTHCLKWIIRCTGRFLAPLIPEIVHQIATLFAVRTHSVFEMLCFSCLLAPAVAQFCSLNLPMGM